MHSIHAPGYSDFFASGIRLVSRRIALEGVSKRAPSPKPIPLSFDGVLSDSDSEDESTKRRSRRVSIFNPLSKSKSASSSNAGLRSSSRTSKLKKHRASASFISNIFGGRKSRHITPTTHVMSNDDSGWLSSASSVASVDDDIDFMDLSIWPECPSDGLEHHPRAITEFHPEPEPLDPFSSSPSSKSFFVDFSLHANSPCATTADGAVPLRRSRTTSTSSWSNRFSFSSISSGSSSFFSSSRRNSVRSSSFLSVGPSPVSPPAETSFLHLPRMSRANKRSSVERKRPASIHVMSTTSVSSPWANIGATTASTSATTRGAPIKVERRRHTQPDVPAHSSQLPLTRRQSSSHTRPRSLLSSQVQTQRSLRARSLFLNSTKPQSISAPIPELNDALADNGNELRVANDEAGNRSRGGVVSTLDFTSISSPEFPGAPDQVSKVDDDADDADDDDDDDDIVVVEKPPSVNLLITDDEAPSSASDARVFFGHDMDDDVTKRVDWREFCIEVLDGHSDT